MGEYRNAYCMITINCLRMKEVGSLIYAPHSDSNDNSQITTKALISCVRTRTRRTGCRSIAWFIPWLDLGTHARIYWYSYARVSRSVHMYMYLLLLLLLPVPIFCRWLNIACLVSCKGKISAVFSFSLSLSLPLLLVLPPLIIVINIIIIIIIIVIIPRKDELILTAASKTRFERYL